VRISLVPMSRDGDGPVEIEDPLSHMIQFIAFFLIPCCQGVEERLQAILTPISPLLQGRSDPRAHPVAEGQRVVQLFSQKRPFSSALLWRGSWACTRLWHRPHPLIPRSLSQAFLHFQGQAVPGEVGVGVALSVTVVLGVDDHATLARIFVGVVLGMPHLPVLETRILFPFLLRDAPAFQVIPGAQPQSRPEFSFFVAILGRSSKRNAGSPFRICPTNSS